MSTYPGEDPSTSDGEQPAEDASPDTSETEYTQPVGYWERQAAEQAAERARSEAPQGRPEPTTPYPQPGHELGQGPSQDSQNLYGQIPPVNPYGPYAPSGPPPYGGQPAAYPPQPGQPQPPQPAPYYYPPQPGQTPYYAYSPAVPDHTQATLALVLGLVGLIGAFLLCGLPLVVSPFAWGIGHNAIKEIKASQGRLGGESQARAGMILGIIGTVLAILAIVAVLAIIVVAVATETATSGSSV